MSGLVPGVFDKYARGMDDLRQIVGIIQRISGRMFRAV
jgi:hypothetical protein